MTSTRRPAHPPISYPIAVDGVEVSSGYRPASPPRTPPRERARRPSITLANPISSWLSRPSAASPDRPAAPQAAPAPVRISEPHFASALDLLIAPRSGVLGSGATVVRTPYDALAPVYAAEDAGPDSPHAGVAQAESPVHATDDRALPPLPLHLHKRSEHADVPTLESVPAPKKPTRPIPPAPATEPAPALPAESLMESQSSIRPVLKHRSPLSSEYFPPVPVVPAHLACAPPQPPLAPVLIVPLAAPAPDYGAVLVTLETSTASFRTALATLLSRPSHLGRWLETHAASAPASSPAEDDDTASVYSTGSDGEASAFYATYHNNVKSPGVRSPAAPTAQNMHVFLDRPSAPYAHVLTYLRSPTASPATLPRAAQLTTTSSSRLEALLELRDEAVFLGLDELAKLCADELAARHRARAASRMSHARTGSGASESAHSRTPSHDSTRTLVMASPVEHERADADSSYESDVGMTGHPAALSSPTRAPARPLADVHAHTPLADLRHPGPAPKTVPGLQQRLAAARSQSENRAFSTVKTRPAAGWI